jgi:hypothetical protein
MTAQRTGDGFVIEACRTCGAPVVWATTKNDKAMPIDAQPVADGNVELAAGPTPGTVAATVLSGPSLMPGPLRKSHFATCPDADDWRRYA